MPLNLDAVEMLRLTSRTFYLSIINLPAGIREAVMSSYLSLRALDEIEDHPQLEKQTKIRLLCGISECLQKHRPNLPRHLPMLLNACGDELPEVTTRVDEWLNLAAKTVRPDIQDATSAMARRMAYWVGNEWRINTKHDLDRYTFSVAGAVGVLLSRLWIWYDGTPSCRADAIRYGRGLQAVNILRNRADDRARGVNFFPEGWTEENFRLYARANLSRGDDYVQGFPPGPARRFCQGPQALAHATLEALARGESKLSRAAVLELVGASSV
jgi:farnesyl-diphosphate farnesyltransferase